LDPDVLVVAETLPPQQTEPLAEAAVEVAQIEANRDIAIAQQHTEQTRIVAEANDAETEEDIAWLRAELDARRAHCERNENEIQNLRAALLTTQDQVTQLAEQMAMLTGLVMADKPPPPQSTPEPSPNPNPPDADQDGQGKTGEQSPPENPSQESGRRKRKWL